MRIIHGEVPALPGQKAVLVRDYGEEHPIAAVQVFVIEVLEAACRPVQGGLVQGVFHRGGEAVGNIDPIVVLPVEQAGGGQGFQCTELVPEGKMILGVGFKAGHEPPAQYGIQGERRHGGQFPPLTVRSGLGRNKQARKATARSSPNRIQTVRFFFLLSMVSSYQNRKYRNGLKEPSTR